MAERTLYTKLHIATLSLAMVDFTCMEKLCLNCGREESGVRSVFLQRNFC